MSKTEKLSASLQDYLEAIFNIISEKGGVRAKDIAEHLGVKAGSVTTALQGLKKSKHINYRPYEVITLTQKGLDEAKDIIRKHEILNDFFVEILGVAPEIAEDSACKMEHVIHDNLLERLISFTEFVQACPRCGKDWIDQFQHKCNETTPLGISQCKKCIEDGITNLEKEKCKMTLPAEGETLIDVEMGTKCIVRKIQRKASITKRLVEMGISRGSIIEVERVAPLGDPIEIKVKGYHLSIRKEEAQNILVEQQYTLKGSKFPR